LFEPGYFLADIPAPLLGRELVQNPGFAQGLRGWSASTSEAGGGVVASAGGVLFINVTNAQKSGAVYVSQRLPFEPNATFLAQVRVRSTGDDSPRLQVGF